MFTFDLMFKLRRCNSRIYLVNKGTEYEGIGLASIWIKKRRKFQAKGLLLSKGSGRLREASAGHIDQLITAIPSPEVPEYDTLMSSGQGIARKGWRTIVKDCVLKEVFSWEQAKKVFGAGVGDSDWDRLGYLEKEAALQREAKGLKWR